MEIINPVIKFADIFHNLSDDIISFQELDIKNTDEIHSYTSDVDVSRYIGWKLMLHREETYEHIETMLKREAAGTHLYASVVLKETGAVIGTVMLFDFHFDSSIAEIGYVFHKNYWGKGYGTRSVALICEFAEHKLKLIRLTASVVDENVSSARILIKNGFLLEERVKGEYQIDGRTCDKLVFCKNL